MKILALDTALGACSAAVLDGDTVLAQRVEPMERGHQERLAPLVAEVVGAAGLGFPSFDRIAVTVGPGSFTGLRVGLAFAKGLALALNRPCIGIGTLEALAAGETGFVAAVIDARRDQIYLQAFADGHPLMAPDVLPASEAAARLAEVWSGGPARLVGPGAALLDGVIREAAIEPRAFPDAAALARLAVTAAVTPPRPLYLRPPDAKTIAERALAR